MRGGVNKRNSTCYEHVVVDDGSTDETASLIEAYCKDNPHVKFIKFPENRGVNAARNAAISRAEGEWCILLDSDDYFVPEALTTIEHAIKTNPGFGHYMFSPDDMQTYYEKNPILKGCRKKVLLYPDFLNGYIGGDFVHVGNTENLRHHPFDEDIRIYEGIFFLQFFRDAQRMLFVNKVVTMRERNREDSVSKEYIRIGKTVIERSIRSQYLMLEHFESDLVALGMTRRLYSIRIRLSENLLLLGRYREAQQMLDRIENRTGKKRYILEFICKFRLGGVCRNTLNVYLTFKYKILKSKLSF